MVFDVECLGDYFGNAGTGPQVRSVAGLSWAFQKDLHQSSLLLRVQTWRAAMMNLGIQCLQSSFPQSQTPTSHRRFGSLDNLCYLLDRSAGQQ
jgi:hypothetical protein